MHECKHTPGPWTIHDGRADRGTGMYTVDDVWHDEPGIAGHTRLLASVWHGGEEPGCDLANSRLIAAAPDLLSALESMVDMFERHIDGLEGPDDTADRWDAAQAAIDKATN